MPVVVVTDSSSSIPADVAQRWGIEVVPLHVLVDGRDVREGVDDVPADLSSATTSGASPAELREVYAAALERSGGDGVLAVHLSQQLSGTWRAATTAADEFAGAVRVLDSRSIAYGLGYPVLAAARDAAAGVALGELAERAATHAAAGCCFVVVERLDQLRRGGRIGTAAALVGTALAIKPVLHLDDGKLVLREKARTSSKALTRLVSVAAEAARGAHGRVELAVQHVAAPERAADIAQRLEQALDGEDASAPIVADIGAVVGTHLGPGAVGIVVVPGESGFPPHRAR
ncbi:DegV family protein [Rhodococcus rhodnii]|uniref:DegV family protein n=2 Tax=Rhodococcus rhodnii TaxID=38312 RepID=R7WR21_9NOCA|nr:DegV family protein [Rhodococcus rhodnii]EOM76419.1 hypothetical protein Rrhod_2212 [Rhodococcus rhodnii LMG 5362]TXG91537.1 DegV family protein [Rhodococcus rhodnii]